MCRSLSPSPQAWSAAVQAERTGDSDISTSTVANLTAIRMLLNHRRMGKEQLQYPRARYKGAGDTRDESGATLNSRIDGKLVNMNHAESALIPDHNSAHRVAVRFDELTIDGSPRKGSAETYARRGVMAT